MNVAEKTREEERVRGDVRVGTGKEGRTKTRGAQVRVG
jgi:hypothetical protein